MQIEEIPLFFDLTTLAVQTDSTRAATFEVPLQFHTNHLDVGSYHWLSHDSKQEGLLTQVQIVENYLMTKFAYLFGERIDWREACRLILLRRCGPSD